MGEVVDLPIVTKLDLDPQRVLQKALAAGMTEVVIVGFGPDGEFFFSSSKADAGAVIWHLEMAKKKLMDICDT
jgi:hypothetical protein